ncbi:AEC family transporter [Trichocoleus sp. FACHB-262]|uniref:AEC family transporter n=1 Tax=Trichocoleus sp. FACHB-262 TaxID=2692869 RepID=UPI0016898F77|nr:AEC family transporter [Trichocoleus sp. FACHB-262]MBD2124076.1 AEC family transporter [Trichocoleus sp. FACHB-262]
MPSLGISLLKLYLPLIGWVFLGLALGQRLPPATMSILGKFLFWIGVPISIVAFLRRASLSGPIWIAPVTAWAAIFLGAGLAWLWLQHQPQALALSKPDLSKPDLNEPHPSKPTRGSFILAAMVGNTGYLGYPVTLTLVGSKYFAWALFYDLLGTTIGAYGLGVVMAARYGMGVQPYGWLAQALGKNPALWSLGLGLTFRAVLLPPLLEQSLQIAAWSNVALSLILIGMRLSQLSSWRSLRLASISLGIKMLVVPFLLGLGLWLVGVQGPAQLVIVLQMAMPPAFATLVIAEAYDLDRDLAVTALAVGSTGLLFTLPIWLWLFQ